MISQRVKSIVLESAVLLGVCIVLSLLANLISPKGIPLSGGQWNPAEGTMHAGGPCAPTTHEMDITSLSHLIERMGDSLVLVDARHRDDYIEGHIPGALSLPIGEVEQYMGEFMEKVREDRLVITYCAGVDCWDSHELADILRDAGFFNIQVFAGGMPDWQAAGKPVTTGEAP